MYMHDHWPSSETTTQIHGKDVRIFKDQTTTVFNLTDMSKEDQINTHHPVSSRLHSSTNIDEVKK